MQRFSMFAVAAAVAAAHLLLPTTATEVSSLPYSFYDDLRQSRSTSFTPLVGKAADEDGASPHVGRNLHKVSSAAEGLGLGLESEAESDVIMCHVPTFFRWSQASSDEPGGYKDVSKEAYGGTAATLLAMHHFNNGIGTIAPELTDIHKTCPIRLTTEVVDSETSGIHAVKVLQRMMTRSPNDARDPQPCAVMGSSYSSTTRKLATVTGVYDLVEVTPSASSVTLDNKGEYPLFTRTHPSSTSMAELSVDYMHNILGVKYFAQLYVDDDLGSTYRAIVVNKAAEYDMVVKSVPLRPGAEMDEVREALLQLKETGYNYFFAGGAIRVDRGYSETMDLAVELGIAGPGHMWMYNGALSSAFVTGETAFPSDSNTAKATFGAAIIHDEGGLEGMSHFDKFLESWRSIPNNPELLEYITSKIPSPPEGSGLNFVRDGEFFQQRTNHIAAFSYDAIVGLALSACEALNQTSDQVFSGSEHHAAFVNKRFVGASGVNFVAPDTFSRDATSTYHIMSNIQPSGEVDDEGMQSFRALPKVYYDSETKEWTKYGEDGPFIYSDGTTDPPPELPDVETDMNQLQPGVRAACLTLSVIAMLMSVGFLVFTHINREQQVIKASQPLFLAMLCVGCLMMAATIIPASIDDAVASTIGCHIACMSKIWLFAIGFCICFSALFSKLYRINKLFKNAKGFKRCKVTTKDVLGPFCVLLTANIIVLITWTAYAPLEWDRTVLEYDEYDRPSSSIGTCYSDKAGPFLWTLVVINGCALVLALWEAYRARNITTEFGESKHIAFAMIFIFQSLFIGVPIMVIVDGQPTPELFVLSAIAFIIVVAMLLLIFLPKIMIMRKGDANGLSSFSTAQGSSIPGSLKGSNPTSFRNKSAPLNTVEAIKQNTLSKQASPMNTVEAIKQSALAKQQAATAANDANGSTKKIGNTPTIIGDGASEDGATRGSTGLSALSDSQGSLFGSDSQRSGSKVTFSKDIQASKEEAKVNDIEANVCTEEEKREE